MTKYEIVITETLQKRIVVEAKNSEEAYDKVYDDYLNGKIDIDVLIDWQVEDEGETDEEITETLQRVVKIDADSLEDARKLIKQAYRDGDIELNYEDCTEVTIEPYPYSEINPKEE